MCFTHPTQHGVEIRSAGTTTNCESQYTIPFPNNTEHQQLSSRSLRIFSFSSLWPHSWWENIPLSPKDWTLPFIHTTDKHTQQEHKTFFQYLRGTFLCPVKTEEEFHSYSVFFLWTKAYGVNVNILKLRFWSFDLGLIPHSSFLIPVGWVS